MPNQNKPGRPPGSSRLNAGDDLDLRRVADRMILDSTLKVTPAMVAVGITDETVQRRLRRKWKPVRDRYLYEARERRAEAAAEQMRRNLQQIGERVAQFAVGANAVVEQIRAGLVRWAEEHREAAAGVRVVAEQMQAFQNASRSPVAIALSRALDKGMTNR